MKKVPQEITDIPVVKPRPQREHYNLWYWNTYFDFCHQLNEEKEGAYTYRQAWEMTEQTHEEKYGWARYDSYESFRSNKQRVFGKKKPTKNPNQLELF